MADSKNKSNSLFKYGININTYNLLFEDSNIILDDENSYENYIADRTIKSFTKQQEKVLTKILKLLYKSKLIDLNNITFNENTNMYKYENNNVIITFKKISDCFYLDEYLIKELTSYERKDKCHIRAIDISPKIKDSKIVTGYITILNKNFLHSIIEYESNGETFILDWTRNLQISKEQYIKLTKFKKIYSFEGSKVIDDVEIFNTLNIGIKIYLTFREEILNDTKKNPKIFKHIKNRYK